MPLFDFACPNDHVTEFRVGSTVQVVDCPECGQPATKQYGAPGMIVGPTLHPNLTRSKGYQESKERAEHGFKHLGVKRP